MKKLTGLLLLLSFSVNAELLWEYGFDDDNPKGRDNAAESGDVSTQSRLEDYVVLYRGETVSLPPDGRTGVGYLHDSKSFKMICTELGLRCASHPRDYFTAEQLWFTVENLSELTCSDIVLEYHRHGTERNEVLILTDTDEIVHMSGINGQEGGQAIHEYVIDESFGPGALWVVSITYHGDGADNGHFIDYISMSGTCGIDDSTGQ